MDYREIKRLAGDPASVRKIAKVLLTVAGLADPAAWERDHLRS
jgi:hypothetical protein